MYRFKQPEKTTIKVNNSYVGEPIEFKIRRILNNKEPITDGAPLIYTDRKDGVRPEMDIRTDRFEIALDGTDAITRSHIAKREERHKPKEEPKPDGGAEPIQGTDTSK